MGLPPAREGRKEGGKEKEGRGRETEKNTHRDKRRDRQKQREAKRGVGLERWLSDCSSRGPEFKSQQPHDGDLTPSSGVSEDSFSVLIYNK